MARMRDVVCFPNGYKHPFMADAPVDDDRVGKQDGEHSDEIVCMLLGYQVTPQDVVDHGLPPLSRVSLVLRRVERFGTNVYERIGFIMEHICPPTFAKDQRKGVRLQDEVGLYGPESSVLELI